MKRSVKTWMLTCIGSTELWIRTFALRRDALNSALPGQNVVRVTITYDDGKKPRKKAAKGAPK